MANTTFGGDYMESLWSKTVEIQKFPSLKGDMKTDVLIVGGGMAGLLCAYKLSEAGADYALIEAGRIACKTTKNTTAKITLQHGLIYADLIKRFGVGKAKMYLKANSEAVETYRALCQNIDCDFEDKDSYVYSLDGTLKLEQELSALEKLSFKAKFEKNLPLPFKTSGSVKISGQAQFNPLKFIKEISKGLKIFEDTKLLELFPGGAVTNRGKIHAKKIIIATHFPILNKHGGYFLKLYQDRSYVVALKNAADVDGMYIDASGNGLSFRNSEGLLLLGGGGHRTGKQGGGYKTLESAAKRLYPNSEEVCRWATQDCMSLDAVPYIGRYSPGTPDIFVATGFNKWGMTSSMVAAKILSDLVLEKENEYSEIFAPSRSILRPQLAVNVFESTVGLLTPTVPRCPHLGCALKYNREEHSWDCPCHGSRFSKGGQLIDGPATDDKNLHK